MSLSWCHGSTRAMVTSIGFWNSLPHASEGKALSYAGMPWPCSFGWKTVLDHATIVIKLPCTGRMISVQVCHEFTCVTSITPAMFMGPSSPSFSVWKRWLNSKLDRGEWKNKKKHLWADWFINIVQMYILPCIFLLSPQKVQRYCSRTGTNCDMFTKSLLWPSGTSCHLKIVIANSQYNHHVTMTLNFTNKNMS